ncbi:MAG: hypothetical protein LBT09_03985 [Planctomycetaceae bacterium]|jgi:hypothetical protein|nr:hypothetical protein [Planctomycetaceae bacterium]
MKNINNVPTILNGIVLIFAVILFSYVSGCDLAKPQNRLPSNQNSENQSITEENKAPSVEKDEDVVQEATVQKEAADTSIKLDQTFEDKDYGFRFNYPATCSLEQGEGIMGKGKLTLWFSKQKIDQDAILITVTWMIDYKLLSQTKAQITQNVKKEGGSLKLFEKIKIDGQECTHIKVAYGGMFDARGNRISEQYFLAVKGSDLMINFSAPANKFETYRPQFIAILNSFKIEN